MLIIEKRDAEVALVSHVFSPETEVYTLYAYSQVGESGEKRNHTKIKVGKEMLKIMMNGSVGTVLNGHYSCPACVD